MVTHPDKPRPWRVLFSPNGETWHPSSVRYFTTAHAATRWARHLMQRGRVVALQGWMIHAQTWDGFNLRLFEGAPDDA